MIGEVAFGGIFVMRMLISLLISLAIVTVLRRVLAWCGAYRFVWHRPLFDLALLVIVLGGVVAATDSWLTL
ncbi:MAG TPA: DUF1656 domain-containing protein [Acetobacteraceae bacterium]|jgi:hypothetical protein|nr:DUF1656 domain-containing protein [Acetobacteraceae bacterium]